MPNNTDDNAWSDNDELETNEADCRKKRCVFCYDLLEQLSVTQHEKICTVAKKCNVSRVLCKSGLEKFVCDICYSTFEFLKSLYEHEKRHVPPGGFFCNYCDSRFCTECDKQQHTEDCHKVYQCRICKKLFETSDKYVDHVKLDHNGKQTEFLSCNICSRMFTTEKNLKRHVDSKCGQVTQFRCEQCQKYFTTKGILKTHMLIHEERKEFVCPYCGKGFHNKYQLKSHEKSHTGEKPWKCNVCNAAFSWKQSLVTHSSLHTGVKPYICECCGSRFSCTSNIIAHRKKRPDTCGLPQYCKRLAKVTPRPSIYNAEMLTTDLPIKVKKNLKVVKECDKKNYKVRTKRSKKSLVSKENKDSNISLSGKCNNKNISEFADENTQLSKNDIQKLVKHEDINSTNNFANNIAMDIKYEIAKETNTFVENEENVNNAVETGNETTTFDIKFEIFKSEEHSFMKKGSEKGFQTIINNNKLKSCENLDENISKTEQICVKEELIFSKIYNENLSTESKLNTIDNEDSSINYDDNVPDFNTDESENETVMKGRLQDSKSDKFKLKNVNVKIPKLKSINKEPVKRRRSLRLNGVAKDITDDIKQNIKKKERHKLKKDCGTAPLRKRTDLIQCPFCTCTVYRKYSLKKHLKRNHQKSDEEMFYILAGIEEKGPSFDCSICKKKFTGKLSYEKHCKLHGDDKSLVIACHDCYGQVFFRTRTELKEHVKNDHNEMKCKECDKSFKIKSSFKEHVLRVHKNKRHPPEPTITCIKCGKLVKKSLLRDHERSNCGKEYLYECKICLKKFSTAGILKEHMKIHTGELTAFCRHCNKGFRNKYQCQQHEMVHTGEKPYKCPYDGCSAAFAHRNNMINHYSLHTGLRRYMCSGCTERFSCISSLKAHWRTHADSCALHPDNSTKAQFKVSLKKGQLTQS